MILKVKDENGQFKEVVLKGLKGEKGEKGDRGEDGTVLQQKEIDDIKSSLDKKANVYLIPEESLEGNILINKRNSVQLGCGTINLNSPIQYGKESKYYGSWWSYGGTIIRPTGDFSAFTPDTSQSIHYTRNEFSNFMLDGKNLSEDTPILKLNKSFLTTFEKIFFINGGTIDITQSDSIRFIDCRFMDGVNKNIKINIGNGARSINFIGCNFENYNGLSCIVNIDGGTTDNQMTTNINFTNCQTERASFKFDNCSNCVIDASKFHATSIVLGEFTNNMKVINVADSTSRIIDLGKDNIIENCVGENIGGFNISKYRLSSDFKATDNYYGEANKEYFIITSIFPNSHNRVTRGKIHYALSSGTEIYRTSSYDLRTDMTTNGTGIRHSFTDMRVLKNPGGKLLIKSSADSGNSTINNNVILKENLIQGGEFISSNEINELWKFKNVTGEIISKKLVVTITSNGEYGIYQSISGLDENKCYMVVMNSDYNRNVVVGDAWNGTQGARKCLGRSVQLKNGTYLSQAYLTNMKSVTLSIGGWDGVAGNEFNINYIALVEI